MNNQPVNIPLFQLRLMEQNWPLAVSRSIQGLPREGRGRGLMEHVLLAETAKWIEVGQQAGYFADTDSDLSLFERLEEEAPVRAFFEFDANYLSDRGFGTQLLNAQTELDRDDRLTFLYFMFFADDAEWQPNLAKAKWLAQFLELDPRLMAQVDAIDELSWFLTGPESSEPRVVSPAFWRLAAPFAEIHGGAGERALSRWRDLELFRERVRLQVEIGAALHNFSSEFPGSAPQLGTQLLQPFSSDDPYRD